MNTSPLLSHTKKLKGYCRYAVKFLMGPLRQSLISFIIGFCIFLGVSRWLTHLPPEMISEVTSLEAIIVFTGDKGRVALAKSLLKTMPSSTPLLISGGYRSQKIIDGCHMIDIECGARNTYENALETRDWMKKKGLTSAFIVTSDYHLLRSLLYLCVHAPQYQFRPIGVSTLSWRRYVLMCSHEYIKCIGSLAIWGLVNVYCFGASFFVI